MIKINPVETFVLFLWYVYEFYVEKSQNPKYRNNFLDDLRKLVQIIPVDPGMPFTEIWGEYGSMLHNRELLINYGIRWEPLLSLGKMRCERQFVGNGCYVWLISVFDNSFQMGEDGSVYYHYTPKGSCIPGKCGNFGQPIADEFLAWLITRPESAQEVLIAIKKGCANSA